MGGANTSTNSDNKGTIAGEPDEWYDKVVQGTPNREKPHDLGWLTYWKKQIA